MMDEEKEFLRHRGLMFAQMKRFKASRVVDHKDYEQVASIALLRAIREHDPARGPFGKFASRVIRNALLNEYRRFRDRQPLLEVDKAYEPKTPFWESIPDLPRREAKILKLKAENYTNVEIGRMVGLNRETVREILQSIKQKIKHANS